LAGKWAELLKEIAPEVARVGVLREPGQVNESLLARSRWPRACSQTCAQRCLVLSLTLGHLAQLSFY
jgi:hypothetical protein